MSSKAYDHKDIEKKWQKRWEDGDIYRVEDKEKGKDNNYVLVEFAYPSGDLHVGHWYAFAVPDIYARYRRMVGDNVLYPFGFDAFGLPAENAAIKHNADPAEWTRGNIERMTKQLKAMGSSFDWSREIRTCEPRYYKWNQWIFNKLFEKGLVYKKKVLVNWDPVDQTVLANEQVLADGTAERSGAKVEKKEMEQWMFKITAYADRLLNNLDKLNWPESIKDLQRNWIGKSEGANIDFEIVGIEEKIRVFTTRPDTLFGATYMVLAPEHELIQVLTPEIENKDEVEAYVEKAKNTSEIDRLALGKEKTGVELKGVKGVNPATKEEIPIYIADYVLNTYGTGAIMAVPAHDERDKEFAEKFSLPIIEVIKEENLINSGEFDGLTPEEAKEKIIKFVDGEMATTYKMRDWSISRQRYWGTPIPIVYDPEGNPHPVPDEHLPWHLPTDVDYQPKGTSPLGSSKELKERTEEIFGQGWTPEIETMDTFMDSSWYFLRYLDNVNDKEFSNKDKQKHWMPVSTYFGGAEHTTVHLLYSRFLQLALYDLGLVTCEEPYVRRFNRGLILNEDGSKMSKRSGAVNPDEQVNFVGADAVKMYLAFMGPYGTTENYPWNSGGVVGIRKFLEKVYFYVETWRKNYDDDINQNQKNLSQYEEESWGEEIDSLLNETIKKVTEDLEKFKFNTAISQMMIFINRLREELNTGLTRTTPITKVQLMKFLKLLAPFAPHLAEELWEEVGGEFSIHQEAWPEYDESKITAESVNLAVQVNGKLRGTIELSPDAKEDEAVELAKKDPKIAKYLDFEPEKLVYVPGKIINFIG